MRHIQLIVLLPAMLLLSSCSQQRVEPAPRVGSSTNYSRPLSPGKSALRKLVNPADHPDFRTAWDERDLFPAGCPVASP